MSSDCGIILTILSSYASPVLDVSHYPGTQLTCFLYVSCTPAVPYFNTSIAYQTEGKKVILMSLTDSESVSLTKENLVRMGVVMT